MMMMMMITIRRTSLSSSTTLRRAHFMFLTCLNHSILHNPSQNQKDVTWKVFGGPFRGNDYGMMQRFDLGGISWIHSSRVLCSSENDVQKNGNIADNDGGSGEVKKKRKKLKGKREVVRWLKFFRYKKKRELQRMTVEEKILFKLKKAKRKEERLLGALKKIEPKETAETTHDPEILTPEEHFYFLKMGRKCKNYVPVGRRGVYQGVILNMHLHWKKHQTLKVIVKTFTPEEVKEIAVELARLSGGIVLDIEDEDTIIMYRGKNYAQPPTEIMSPRITLPRKKALDKSKYRDALHAVRRYIPRLEQELELLQAQAETKNAGLENSWSAIAETIDPGFDTSDRWKELMANSDELKEDGESMTDSENDSDSEALSDIFESESDSEGEVKVEEKPLYLDAFEKLLPPKSDETDDFEEHLRQISADSTRQKLSGERAQVPDLDEVDKMIIHAASLLKKKRR